MSSPWACESEGLQRQIEICPCGSRWLPVEAMQSSTSTRLEKWAGPLEQWLDEGRRSRSSGVGGMSGRQWLPRPAMGLRREIDVELYLFSKKMWSSTHGDELPRHLREKKDGFTACRWSSWRHLTNDALLCSNHARRKHAKLGVFLVFLSSPLQENICSAEMVRDVAPEVERLLQNRDPNTKKKAALCSIRIVRKVPDLAENFMGAAASSLLKEKHHGVLISVVELCTELCKASTEALEYLRKVKWGSQTECSKCFRSRHFHPSYYCGNFVFI